MEDGERKGSEVNRVSGVIQVKKHGLLNKFLTKTYHMIDTCDPLIATWSDDGKSFQIQDVKEFSKTILPKFFKHSKFPSFVRQLNFYSFRKLRQQQTATSRSVRFAHKWFQRGCPELLHNIQRITKSSQDSSAAAQEVVKSLKEDMDQFREAISDFRVRMDQRLEHMQAALEMDFQQRMAGFSLSYQLISNIALQVAQAKQQQQRLPPNSAPEATETKSSTAPSETSASRAVTKDTEPAMPKEQHHTPPTAPSPPPAAVWSAHNGGSMDTTPGGTISPTSVVTTQEVILETASKITKKQAPICPLMALSMVASMDHQQEFGGKQ
mmetsp:Transcript_55893/g.161894  ORF Transcript_55893/g.161894 Transcript_55893/m.161894 type:complete len:324 (-) Transcript_55893:31-1002(-)